MEFVAYTSGVVVLVVLWVLYRVLGRTWNPGKLIEGADGRPSTSKLQWFLWTVVVVFSYSAIYAARAWTGNFGVISDIPQNLLIAMGLSVTTMAAAKGITVSYVSSGQVTKKAISPETASSGAIIQDDDQIPDLSKIQMMAWTLIAIGIYLIRLVQEINTVSPPQLPDIDTALMVLMGLGQGAYLGKKLVTTTVPRLMGVSPGSGSPGTEITIIGASFGEQQNSSLITIDGSPISPGGLVWGNTQIKFELPAKQLNGNEWPPGQRILIGIIVGGQDSANTLPFTISK